MAKYVLGLKSVKFGTPTDESAMPTSMEAFAQTVRGSMTVSETEPTIQDFNVEEQDAPVEQAITESSKLEVTWRAYDLSPAILEKVKGGDSDSSSWEAPAKAVMIKLALEIETDNGTKIQVPKANVIARFDGTVGREDMLQLEVTATALDPGDGGSPFSVVFPS
jgi:hypothetical protein